MFIDGFWRLLFIIIGISTLSLLKAQKSSLEYVESIQIANTEPNTPAAALNQNDTSKLTPVSRDKIGPTDPDLFMHSVPSYDELPSAGLSYQRMK